ncbi:type II toxin-antitoxin system PemK/MazF family toxin [Arthrobacter mobilis]|uniref:Type II toxin-antitoxin system PemK/MazF family toxin n=1 Tax=Arthrobacter mobilis TaxID=2724944 RepID=A0A7X6K5Y6_9MICC|nr:type II toxin-antitoxin system PemK/MazF family toxin [Arthrobacter mobilis]NKX54038.1 type II toxin-antitoxin system PemK/MazF family toxin [Arthrobacter mobilis]
MPLDTKTLGRILRSATRIFRAAAGTTGSRTRAEKPSSRDRGTAATAPGRSLQPHRPYAGDFTGRSAAVYSPTPDGRPDPGEVVWTWVPYEEDHTQGKDRPVLLVGRSGGLLLGLMLTSRDRNNGRRRDEDYLDVGTGAWDPQGRPSEVKLDRILQIDPRDIRREGAVLGPDEFGRVARALRQLHGW